MPKITRIHPLRNKNICSEFQESRDRWIKVFRYRLDVPAWRRVPLCVFSWDSACWSAGSRQAVRSTCQRRRTEETSVKREAAAAICPQFNTDPLMISLLSPRMKISRSGVTRQSAFLWPVRGSASAMSEHRFMLTVPCGRVLGCRTVRKNLLWWRSESWLT